MTRDGFAKLLKASAAEAGIQNAHPHALRHACGHALAMKGRDTSHYSPTSAGKKKSDSGSSK
jgi:site-specific recombinase XerD